MQATITNIVTENNNVKTFIFDTFFVFLPGQWMWVRLNPDLKHHFTISCSPTEKHLQFTTMFRQESDYKKFLWQLNIGDKVDIEGPHGEFVLHETDTQPRLFLAGGIGITPYRSWSKYIADKKLPTDLKLIYSVKNKSDGLFGLPTFETAVEGHLSIEKLQVLVPDWHQRAWYACGPAVFVDACIAMGKTLNVPVVSEDFPGY